MSLIDKTIKEDLKLVSKMQTDDLMNILNLDGEDSAIAVQEACKAYVRSDLGRDKKSNELGVKTRKSARVSRGGPAW